MKQLTLVRHAKSSWDNPSLSDFERPLNKRGQRDLPLMAKRVRDFDLHPNLMLYSSAVRTSQTAEALADALRLPGNACIAVPEMYEACWETLLNLLQGQDDSRGHILLVGHNPGIADLGNYLCDEQLSHVPTSAVQYMLLSVLSWSELSENCATRQIFDYPKLHK